MEVAIAKRRQNPDLETRLTEEPYRFEFFQAVRLLEQLDSQRAPVGEDALAGGERRLDFSVEIAGGGKIVAVAEDRRQAPRNSAGPRFGAHKRFRHAVGFQRAMQPIAVLFISVAVADERPVFIICHSKPYAGEYSLRAALLASR